MSEPPSKAAPSNRKFYLLVTAIVLAAVLSGVISALRTGPTELEQLKADLRAKGEKLTFEELMPGVLSTNRPPSRAADLERIVKVLRAKSRQVEAFELIHHLGDGSAEPVWSRTNLLTSAGKNSPGSAVGWQELNETFAAVEGEITEAFALVAILDTHAGLNFDIFARKYQHLGDKGNLVRWFAAIHAAHLRVGRVTDAMLAWDAAMQLAEWHQDELTVIDQRARVVLALAVSSLTWSTLQFRDLRTAQINHMLERWLGPATISHPLRAMEVERAMGLRAFTLARERGVSALLGGSERALDPLRKVIADGDELFFLRQSQTWFDLARRAESSKSFSQAKVDMASFDAELETQLRSWRGIGYVVTTFSWLGTPGHERSQKIFHRGRTNREMSLAALALELHRRKHGRHPESLARLVPEFLPAVPVDWMDGQPLRYRLESDGSYTLWSVGDNLTDDGGDASGPPVNMRRNDMWEGRDAVWPRLAP